ncbi:MAG: Hypoxic response protein 1 [Chloroflexi bacterium]|nr:Hypoxic response protein 1 [Chloroflexota bacterium]
MLVKERMSLHPLTMKSEASITEVHRYMKENNIRHLPVMNKKEKLVGLVSRETLMEAMPSSATTLNIWEINYALSKVKVGDVMVRDVITVEENVTIEEAARVMIEKQIGSLPVMRGEVLVGIITETDMLSTLMELVGTRRAGVRITLQGPTETGVLAGITGAIAEKGGSIAACGTYEAEEPLRFNVVLKVRHILQDDLVATLEALNEIEVLNVRTS